SIACQCASIRPGMSVRPPPSMTVAFSGAAMSPAIFSILLPATRTDVLAVSLSDLPSNTFTFLNRVELGCVASVFAAGGATGMGGAGRSDTCLGGDPSGAVRKPRSPAVAKTSTLRVAELPISRPPSQHRLASHVSVAEQIGHRHGPLGD